MYRLYLSRNRRLKMIHKTFENVDMFLDSNDELDRFFKYEIDNTEDEKSRWKYHLSLFQWDGSSFDLYEKENIKALRDFLNEMLEK